MSNRDDTSPPASPSSSPDLACPESTRFGGARPVPILALFAFAVVLYSGTLTFGFVWDDIAINVTQNSLVGDLRNIPSYFAKDYGAGSDQEMRTPYYRPMFKVSIALDHALWKNDPFGYHLTNVLIHGFVVILVYITIAGMRVSRAGAFAGALLFAAHPVHAETVSYVANRTDLLSTLLVLVSYSCHVEYRAGRDRRFLAFSLTTFLAALLTKEMAVTLPGIMLLSEVCFSEGRFREKLKWPLIYTAAVVVPYLIARQVALERFAWTQEPLAWRFYTSIGIVAGYSRLLILPIDLKLGYDLAVQTNFFARNVIVPLIAICAAVPVLGVTLWKGERRAFFGLAWIFLALLPISGLPALVTIPFLMADHCLYLPSVGLAILSGSLFGRAWEAISGKPLKAAAAVLGIFLLCLLSIQDLRRQSVWRDDLTLWTNMVKDAPNRPFAYNNLAAALLDRGRPKDAEPAMLRSLELEPRNPHLWLSLAKVYLDLGREAEAVNAVDTAVRLDPGNKDALAILEMLTRKAAKK